MTLSTELNRLHLCTDEQADEVFEKPQWVASLISGDSSFRVYENDHQAWGRLRILLSGGFATLDRLHLRFRTNWVDLTYGRNGKEVVGASPDATFKGYFLIKGWACWMGQAGFGTYTVGYIFDNGEVCTETFTSPSLSHQEFGKRTLLDCPLECIILL